MTLQSMTLDAADLMIRSGSGKAMPSLGRVQCGWGIPVFACCERKAGGGGRGGEGILGTALVLAEDKHVHAQRVSPGGWVLNTLIVSACRARVHGSGVVAYVLPHRPGETGWPCL